MTSWSREGPHLGSPFVQPQVRAPEVPGDDRVEPAASRGWWSTVGAYVALTKPRIIELLLVTTVPTMIVAQRGLPPIWLMVTTVVGGTLAAGGANAINMYIDRDIDQVMRRTRHRPLVTGAIRPQGALIFAASPARGWWPSSSSGPLVNLLMLDAWRCERHPLLRSSSTPCWRLKRTSTSNIVIGRGCRRRSRAGGLGGRHPDRPSWAPVVLFAVPIFMWTPPHFATGAGRPLPRRGLRLPPRYPCSRSSPACTRPALLTRCCATRSSCGASRADRRPPWPTSSPRTAAAPSGSAPCSTCRTSCACSASPRPRSQMRVFTWSITYLTLLFGAMALDACSCGAVCS